MKQKEERQAGLIKKFYSADSKILLLSDFVFEEHLVNEVDNKQIYVLGHFLRDPTDNKCVISFEKTEFIESKIKDIFNGQGKRYRNWAKGSIQKHHNNEFRKYEVPYLPNAITNVVSKVIYPASEQVIAKYSKQQHVVINESTELYSNVVKPQYIEANHLYNIGWIQGVLSGKEEQDKEVLRTDQFILQLDWE